MNSKKARSIACNSLFIYYLTFSLFLPPSSATISFSMVRAQEQQQEGIEVISLYHKTQQPTMGRSKEKKKATENETFFPPVTLSAEKYSFLLLTVISGRVGKGGARK
ncbi:hypothetical protein CEXT_346031 [Caerostris extrusa]|uniref:Secreted protein n=1 Tax=Caerostris extrusa TaxID=172846 RepID=A0AAV4T1U7_CAEEX|nr:hypothetical protein CEXT_346031 [Caerostris extrusa]